MTSSSEPAQGIGRIALKLRTQGLPWIWRRLAAEALLPTTAAGRALHRAVRRTITLAASAPRALRRASGAAADRQTLHAFYDLKVAPVTFDYLWFLAGADIARRRSGLDRVHVVIVPGPHDGVRREHRDYERVVDAEGRRARIHNVLLPAASLLPACAGVTLAESRRHAAALRATAHNVYPADYETALPVYPSSIDCIAAARAGERTIGVLRATEQALADVERWLASRAGSRRVVTVTLRAYRYMPARNSNLAAWAAFARGLDRGRYFPVIVPDTEQAIEGLPRELEGLTAMPEAAWNLPIRMALYERAWLNLGVNNGPMGLCWLNDRTRFVTLKMATPGVPQTTLDYMRSLGFEAGHSLPFATPYQEFVWQDDTPVTIAEAFRRMEARIEADA